jgi:post-segregation antitoxin (ccd killing protein)
MSPVSFPAEIVLQDPLNERAEKAGINFSQVLQDGLKQRLNVSDL